MITDKLENINKYIIVSNHVSDFLKSLTHDFGTGHYVIDDTAYANIDVYATKDISLCKFEAHKKYIDIQMLLDGEERLDYISVDGLSVSEEYNPGRDVMFFNPPCGCADSLFLKPGKFALLFPHEAHMPQINSAEKSVKVKKVVVKILADKALKG